MARRVKYDGDVEHDWDALAERIRSDAEALPYGPEREEALRKARLMSEAAFMRRALTRSA